MWTLPNIITIVRICFTPVIALLPFIEGYWPKLIAFVIFILAAVSDIVDGYLARSRNEVSDFGKQLDPIADKLLLFAMLVPIYWISRQRHDLYDIPVWGSIPLWVCLLLIGREVAMTGFRWWASRRGVIIPAGGAGKLKTTIQNVFIGAIILWFAFRDARKPLGWEHSRYAEYWNQFHGGFVAVTLAVAALLTVYSFVQYLYRNRRLFSRTHGPVRWLRPRPPASHEHRARHHRHRAAPRLYRRHQRRRDRPGAGAHGVRVGPPYRRGRPGGRDPRGRLRGAGPHRRGAHHRRARSHPR